MYKRKNTIKIVFQLTATRPSALEIHWWLVNKLNVTPEQVDTMQLNSREKAIYLKFITEIIFNKFVRKCEDYRNLIMNQVN